MVLFLGIDGGGTGCRAALADTQGRILGEGSAGPANVNTDMEGARQNILEATLQALSGSGASMGDLCAALGLAGANVSGAAQRLAGALPFARVQIVSDAITAARGALGRLDGIVAAMGTGSVFAVSRDGTLRQYGGRGFVLGDEGSGAVLGRTLLAEALRAEDGFATLTPLLRAVLAEFGGAEGAIAFATRARPVDFAALAPRVVAQDDPAARRLFDLAAEEVGRIIAVLQQGGSLPVVFLGGLAPHYAARLSARWETRAALGSSLDGAVQMARELAERV